MVSLFYGAPFTPVCLNSVCEGFVRNVRNFHKKYRDRSLYRSLVLTMQNKIFALSVTYIFKYGLGLSMQGVYTIHSIFSLYIHANLC